MKVTLSKVPPTAAVIGLKEVKGHEAGIPVKLPCTREIPGDTFSVKLFEEVFSEFKESMVNCFGRKIDYQLFILLVEYDGDGKFTPLEYERKVVEEDGNGSLTYDGYYIDPSDELRFGCNREIIIHIEKVLF